MSHNSIPNAIILDEPPAALKARTTNEVRSRPCPQCGWPIEAGDRFCPNCGGREIESSDTASPPAEAPLRKHIECKNCGSRIETDSGHRSYVCPFCESTYVIELPEAETGRQRPEFVLPFAVPVDEAWAIFRRWLAEQPLIRPGDLKRIEPSDKLRGVYLPFWSFSTLAESRWKADIGEYWYTTETYTVTNSQGKTETRTRRVQHTEWWKLQGDHHSYHSGYMVSASQGLAQRETQRIQPFHPAGLKRYRPEYLAGWLCEEYTIDAPTALEISQQEFSRRECDRIAAFLPGDTYSGLEVSTDFSQTNSDLCLLPMYLAQYKYRNKIYRFLINGQTGRIAGEKPLSWVKLLCWIGGGVLAAVLIFLLLTLVL